VTDHWKDGIMLSLQNGKGPKFQYCNYCVITLLSVVGKVFADMTLAPAQPRFSMGL